MTARHTMSSKVANYATSFPVENEKSRTVNRWSSNKSRYLHVIVSKIEILPIFVKI